MLTIDKKYSVLESSLLDYFEEHKDQMFSNCHPSVKTQRQKAINYFKETGLPSKKDEKWRNSLLPKIYDQP